MHEADAEHGTWVAAALARYERRLVAYARRLTGDLERAREIVQEVFLRLWTQPEARVRDRLAEWLYTVCRNLAIDLRRKEGRMGIMSPESLDTGPASDASPATAVEQRQAVSRLLQCVAALPEQQQEVLRLKFQHDLSYKEIAHITGMTVSHVGVVLHHAVTALRTQCTEPGGVQ
ncbi:MAG: sigma-70 family RNA polymerase sigma factor [Deltaproteobacteria bacterium]|nr:sigma-70 family RNA polymerase sigma factor [Deltaproteobacteria bacterium]